VDGRSGGAISLRQAKGLDRIDRQKGLFECWIIRGRSPTKAAGNQTLMRHPVTDMVRRWLKSDLSETSSSDKSEKDTRKACCQETKHPGTQASRTAANAAPQDGNFNKTNSSDDATAANAAPLDAVPAAQKTRVPSLLCIGRAITRAGLGHRRAICLRPPIAVPSHLSRITFLMTIADDTSIPLRDIPSYFPESKFTLSTLRAEAGRGRLAVFRIGRRDYTTFADVREMQLRCREEDHRRASTSIRHEGSGLSETERLASAQAALSQTVQALKGASPSTSAKSTGPRAARTH
jgi:hypothetical protein